MDRSEAPTFVTARAELRPWRDDEAPRLFDIRRRTEVARWLGDPIPWTDLATARDAIAAWATMCREDAPLGRWAIVPRDTDVPVGTVSLSRLPGDTEVEIGWYLHPDATGAGWAREAAARVLAHGVAHGIEPVWAVMWPHNDASAAVAAAIGMTDLGVRDDLWYGTEVEPTSRMFRTGPA